MSPRIHPQRWTMHYSTQVSSHFTILTYHAKSPATIRSRSKKTGNVLYDYLAVRVLLRATGLGVVAALTDNEPPKQVAYKSRPTVVWRSAVHIVPAAVSLFLAIINIRGYFIGASLQGEDDADSLKFAALQVIAKIQVCHPPRKISSYVLSPFLSRSCLSCPAWGL